MTTPTGTITMANIQTEFGGATPISLSEYYAGGMRVSSAITGVATIGNPISMGSLRGKSATNYGTLKVNKTKVSEGGSVTFTLSGGDIGSGTLYWALIGAGLDANDFMATSGSFVVTNSVGSFTVTAKSDTIVEGARLFRANVGIASGVPVTYVASPDITLDEPHPTYAVSFSPSEISEGLESILTLTTVDVPAGTPLFYTIVSGTGFVSSADVLFNGVPAAFSGTSVVSSSGVDSIRVAATYDTVTEANEYLTVQYRLSDSPAAPVVCQANLLVTNRLGTVWTLTLTSESTATTSDLYLQITALGAYPAARSFGTYYSLNGGSWTGPGTYLTVPANGTYSDRKLVSSNQKGKYLASTAVFKVTSPGHADALSNTLYNVNY